MKDQDNNSSEQQIVAPMQIALNAHIQKIQEIIDRVKGADAANDPVAQKNKDEFIAASDKAIRKYEQDCTFSPVYAAGSLATAIQEGLQQFSPPGLADGDMVALSECASWAKSCVNNTPQAAPQPPAAPQPQGGIPEVAGSGLFGALAGLLGRKSAPKIAAAAPAAPEPAPAALVGPSFFAQTNDTKGAAPVAPPVTDEAPSAEAVAAEPEKMNTLQFGAHLLSVMSKDGVNTTEVQQILQQSESLSTEKIGEESEEWSKQATQISGDLLKKSEELEAGEQNEEIKSLIKLAKEMAARIMKAADVIAEKLLQASNEENASLSQTKGAMFKPR